MHVGHELIPVTEVEVSELRKPTDVTLRRSSPEVVAALIREVVRDAGTIWEHLVNIGRREPKDQTGHLLLELGVRL